MKQGFNKDGFYYCGTGCENGESGKIYLEKAKDWRNGKRIYCNSSRCKFDMCAYKNPPIGNIVPEGIFDEEQ